MTAQTTLGGVNRDALLRLWFLFYVWAFVMSFFGWNAHWGWSAWVYGSALTCFLIYRRSPLAGIVGYIVSGTAVAAILPQSLRTISVFFFGPSKLATYFQFPDPLIVQACYYITLAVVPTAVLVMHVASRHRLLRAFEGSVAERRHGRTIAPSSYYLITLR